MKNLTEEEFEFLSKYEDRFNSAATANYVRAIPSGIVHKMREIYSRLIEKPYAMNENCGSCILNLCRKIKPVYDEYKETIQRNSTGCTTETQSDPSDVVGGKEQTGDTNTSSE